jgi:hypothetical protein
MCRVSRLSRRVEGEMAKSKTNKSDAIREALAQKPDAKASEVVSLLAGRGIKVSTQLVHFVKAKGRAKVRKAKRQAVAKVGATNGRVDVVALLGDIKALAEKAGGLKELKKYVDVLAE